MSREQLSDGARLACLDQANRALFQSALVGVPASILLVLILGASVPIEARRSFVAVVCLADVVTFLASGAYLRRRRNGEAVARYWVGPCCTAATGVAWGSLAIMGLPDEVEPRVVYLLFVCGTSATFVVGAAARRLYYFSSQTPMLFLVALGFFASSDRTTRLLGLAIPIYFVVMTALHHEVHNVVVRELVLRERHAEAGELLRKANARLAERALHDELTGLPNRASMRDALLAALDRSRDDGSTVGVLYIDVDRFKVVNDSRGHGGGDALLQGLAVAMQRALRGGDLLARFGGDEFVVLLDRLRAPSDARLVADRLGASFSMPIRIDEGPVTVSVSIGVATTTGGSIDADTLVSHADAAQYRAKQQGGDRVEVFDEDLSEAMQRRLDDEQELRVAINRGQIVPWFQPVVDLHTGSFTGAEALARWQHPTRGVLDGYRFVPLAQDANLIVALDDRVIRAAVEARVAISHQPGTDSIRFWCNVSPAHFSRAHPTDALARLLDELRCEPQHIGIEITETAILPDIDVAAREIAQARELGVRVALDDFGTGHASLMLLRSLMVDEVKIDRTFVRDITRDTRDAAIVDSIVRLASNLGIDVVAEGVETPEQARLLREVGCRYAQGYLWSKAIPLEDLVQQIASHAQSVVGLPSRSASAVPTSRSEQA